jgi:chromosome segregation ATPase
MGHMVGNSAGSHGWVSTSVAAAALGIKPRQCRNLIQEGELEARLEGEGRDRRYMVSIASLEALRDKRQSEGKLPLGRRNTAEDEDVGAELGQWVRELTARLETRAAENAELRTRLELTEKADSTLREQLERERARADRLEERAEQLRDELEAERSKGFWQRLFGGNS